MTQRYNIFLLFLSIFFLSYLAGCGSTNEAQEEQAMQDTIDEIKMITGADSMSVRKMPKLKGSRRALNRHVKYPERCREARAEGTVIVGFTVTKTGEMKNFEIIRGIHAACNRAAIQALKRYAEFTPGTKDGKPVEVQMSFPIMFRLR